MPQTKSDWAEALLPGIREWFSVGYNRRPTQMAQFFNVLPSSSDSEFYHSFGAVSPDAWENFENSGQIAAVSFDRGYKTTFTHNEFLVELPIRRTLVEDNKYPQILDAAAQLGDSAALKRERDAASVFNNYSSASHTGGDAVALGSNSHPQSPGKASATQDNLFASTALSATNVETVRLAMMAFTDDVGELCGIIPDLLVVPPALENTAKNICGADGELDSADNNLNPQKGRFSYVMWPYLSSATTWFMVDSAKMKQSLIWFDREPLDIYPKDEDTTVFYKYIARMRYSYGWRDWRWVGCAAA
jgi:phage major head subunit gpT-like protein